MPFAEEAQNEEKKIDPIRENRIRILKLSNSLLAEMFVQGRKIAYEVIENGLPEDAICIDGGIVGEEMRLVIASASFEPYSQDPVDGAVPLIPDNPGVVVRKIDLPVNTLSNAEEVGKTQ